MLTQKEIKQDLEDICAQTNAHWLSYDDIHTEDPAKDIAIYLKEQQRLGYPKGMLLLSGNIELSYGGGIEIKHQEEAEFSGYTLTGYKGNNNRLVFLSGFETDNDKHTIYHECAHLLQFKYDIFDMRNRNEYTRYLSEVHANTFSAMVLFLKADNILEYKKYRLGRFADGVFKLSDPEPEMLYYASLPIELQLIKEIKKNGRLKTKQQFSKDGKLDFNKIFFYTKKLVEKYAYSPQEFQQLKRQKPLQKHLLLQKKAKAYRILGKAYWKHEYFKYRKKIKKHTQIEQNRIDACLKKVTRLPDITHRIEVLNEICRLDCCQVEMISQYGIFNAIAALKKNSNFKKTLIPLNDTPENKENILQLFETMRSIYKKYKKDKFFRELFAKLETFQGRDEIWNLKEKERQNIAAGKLSENLKKSKQNSR